MFQCNQCHTEYGGIRGISSGTCPRCRQRESTENTQPSPATAAGASRRSPQLTASSWSSVASPLPGPVAQLDQAARA
jgi:hypothetical protein